MSSIKLYRKFISLLLALLLVVGLLGGCGSKKTDSGADVADSASQIVSSKDTAAENCIIIGSIPETSDALTPLLYKVEDKSGHLLWLFGSIHIGTKEMETLPDYVMNAYKGSDILAVECDIISFYQDSTAITETIKSMAYQDGTNISDHISPELYRDSVNVLKGMGIYMSYLDSYKPVLWSQTIESDMVTKAGFDSDLGIDMTLMMNAAESGKEIAEIESCKFQYDMMSGFSDGLQAMILEDTVDAYDEPDEYKKELGELVEAWCKGDRKRIVEEDSEEILSFDADEKQLYDEYTSAILTNRDKHMTDYAENALASGKNVFICVGAMHVFGKNGIVDTLVGKGYKVTQFGGNRG